MSGMSDMIDLAGMSDSICFDMSFGMSLGMSLA
jgi:hypothetical protein